MAKTLKKNILNDLVGASSNEGSSRYIKVDGARIEIRADQEILLECGESSLLLTREGKIVIKGVKIVSRAAETNKVRGATVKIN